MKSVLLESVVIAVIGAVLAFTANALSPRGLKLSRNYFPTDTRPKNVPTAQTNTAAGATSTNSSSIEVLTAKLKEYGFQLTDSNQVVQLFHDPRLTQDLIVFVDARNEDHYSKGHVPGAYLLDYYHPETYLLNVLPLAQNAEVVVVYCNGGDCEDSQLTAVLLRDAGIPPEKVHIYIGGMAEWEARGLPVETGARGSGQMRQKK